MLLGDRQDWRTRMGQDVKATRIQLSSTDTAMVFLIVLAVLGLVARVGMVWALKTYCALNLFVVFLKGIISSN